MAGIVVKGTGIHGIQEVQDQTSTDIFRRKSVNSAVKAMQAQEVGS
jgi:hypothetical protein